jgi:hypothetical protein
MAEWQLSFQLAGTASAIPHDRWAWLRAFSRDNGDPDRGPGVADRADRSQNRCRANCGAATQKG